MANKEEVIDILSDWTVLGSVASQLGEGELRILLEREQRGEARLYIMMFLYKRIALLRAARERQALEELAAEVMNRKIAESKKQGGKR
jgi:hypothetical protein